MSYERTLQVWLIKICYTDFARDILRAHRSIIVLLHGDGKL